MIRRTSVSIIGRNDDRDDVALFEMTGGCSVGSDVIDLALEKGSKAVGGVTGGAGDIPTFADYCREVLPQARRRASFLSHTVHPIRLFLTPVEINSSKKCSFFVHTTFLTYRTTNL